MRIGNSPIEIEDRPRVEAAGAVSRTSDVARADTVSLSARAEAPASSLRTTSTKVAEIRARVQSGEYPIDLHALAERIVDDEMLRAGKG